MKPVPFDYMRPRSIAEACALLAEDPGTRPIAGGQTLIPMLAMRLARPTRLVDLASIAGLSDIRADGGWVEIGAMARQAIVERSVLVKESVPLLTLALPWVGHAPTRARGTLGGSIANADPSAEIPLVAVTLGAEILISSPDGDEVAAAEDFFIASMVTSLPEGGLVRAVRFPAVGAGRVGFGFAEVNARNSDFAFVAAAAQIEREEDDRLRRINIGIGGLTDIPIRVDLAGLIGRHADPTEIGRAVAESIEDIDAFSDLQASAAYRRRAAKVLAERAARDALWGAST